MCIRASTEEPKDTASERGAYRPTSSLEYVNIRRPKASTTTEANDERYVLQNWFIHQKEVRKLQMKLLHQLVPKSDAL